MAADMTPPVAAAAFLAAHGWPDARIEPVAGDASFRRYFRVIDGTRSAILMDAPPPQEDPRPFIEIARWLTGRGFAAPEIHATDLDTGLVLLEDFGDVRMRETVDAAPEREARCIARRSTRWCDCSRRRRHRCRATTSKCSTARPIC